MAYQALRTIARLIVGVAVPVMIMFPAAASAAPDDGPLVLEVRPAQSAYRPGEPVRLTFLVSNNADRACGLSKVADGTVDVMSVRRDGEELEPVLTHSLYIDGLGGAIRAGMVTVAPGSAVEVVLTGIRIADGMDAGSEVLPSVTAAPGGAAMGALWPIGTPGRYEVTAGYAVPPVGGAIASCVGAASARTVSFMVGEAGDGAGSGPWVLIGAVVVVAIGAVAVVVLVRRRRRSPAAAILVLVAVAAAVGAGDRSARADVYVDPTGGIPIPGIDLGSQVDACMKRFAMPGGDPARLLPRLKDKKTPRVRIISTTDDASRTWDTGGGTSTITWNPISYAPYHDGVAGEPCASLYHELAHADDISRDQVPPGYCGDTGIPTAEVKATFIENRYRKNKRLPQRTTYEDKKLPKSYNECRKSKKKKPTKGPVRLCLNSISCGGSTGDPHMVTFDQSYYDFMSVGEFVVVRSTTGEPLEIQARQAPFLSSRRVSVNSALAFLIGTHTVSLTLADGMTRVHVDGQLTAVARGERALPGGGVLAARESDIGPTDGYDLRWPDGSEAAVDKIGSFGYRLLVRLADGRAGKVEGLLGNFDGDQANDIAPPGGAPLAQPLTYDVLYPSYADSWRVDQKDSLFTYAAGQSTETFTDRAFPDKPFSVKDLDSARRNQAERACRWAGLTGQWQLNECVFDVGVTGRPDFAVSSAGTELVAPAVAAPISATPIASGTLTAGGNDRVRFAGQAGQAVFVDAIGPALRDQCSPYRLLDPVGKRIASGCHISGLGHIDRTELTKDGQYSVVLDADARSTGRVTVRVYAAEDTNGTIDPTGARVTAAIEQPGSLVTYRFTARAGQRVFVDLPESTLPDQCSPLRLYGPDDRRIASGCVINGVGDIEGPVLAKSGQYTVVVDPDGRAIGSIALRLFAAEDVTETIAVNGHPVVATIDQPGRAIRYAFTGTAGAAVTVEASDGTLPDECSPLQLLAPGGRSIASACVVGGEGSIEAAVLPHTGRYELVVDPLGSATGSVTLEVRA